MMVYKGLKLSLRQVCGARCMTKSELTREANRFRAAIEKEEMLESLFLLDSRWSV